MSDFSQVTAVILAGGMGVRLRKIVSDRPKVLAEINGNPFIYYLLDQLAEANIERVIICTGYMADKIKELVGSTYKDMLVDYSKENSPLGTGGALRLAEQIIDTEYCLILNGDSYAEFDLFSFWKYHLRKSTNILILLNIVENVSRFGSIQMDERNEIINFTEKGSSEDKGLINAGVYLMKSSIIKNIPGKTPCSLEHDFFPKMVGNGLYGYETKKCFIDIGTPKSYSKAEYFFKTMQAHRLA